MMIGSSSAITSSTSSAMLNVDELQRHPPGLDAGDVEDLVDDRQQVAAVRVDARRAAACAGGSHRPGDALQQHVRVAEDRVERRPELVRHVREELRLQRRGLLELDAPGAAAARSAARARRSPPGPCARARPTPASAARTAAPSRSPRVRSCRMVTTARQLAVLRQDLAGDRFDRHRLARSSDRSGRSRRRGAARR